MNATQKELFESVGFIAHATDNNAGLTQTQKGLIEVTMSGYGEFY